MPLAVRRYFGDVSRCGDGNANQFPNVIRFSHPGYAITGAQSHHRDALLALPAFDDGGIHYDTAHTACGVLAGNRWDGYFSLDRDGSTRVQPPADGILREPAYFFCLPPSSNYSTSTDPYPVVARFRDWQFPHRNLPPCWERLRARFRQGAARGAARSCIVTDCGFSLDNAHLVPVNQSRWYDDNTMMDYGTALSFSTAAVNAPTNIVLLRTDVHRMFDERHFCFVPKPDQPDARALALRTRGVGDNVASMDNSGNENPETEQDQHQTHDEASRIEQELNTESAAASRTQKDTTQEDVFVGHVFTLTPGGELQKLWHNREAHPGIYAASLECLFARFAWTVFSPNVFCNFLLMAKEPRLLLVCDEVSGRYISEWRDPEKCQLTLRAAQSRSESPTKRQRSAKDAERDKDNQSDDKSRDNHRDFCPDTDSGYHGDLYGEGDLAYPHWEEEERGRSRKRKYIESIGAFKEDNIYRRIK